MATVAKKEYSTFGNKNVVLARLTSVSNGDTFVTGLKHVDSYSITNEASSATVGGSESGGTITFAISTGTPTVRVIAFGS